MGKGLVVILSGACSVGKHTLIKKLCEDNELNLMYSVSLTTRPKKENEVDGKDYYFVDFKAFASAVKKHELLEYTEFNGWYYGTPKNQVEFLRDSGKNVLIAVEAQGVGPIKLELPDALAIFVTPATIEDLEDSIHAMYQDDEASVQRRINKAKMDMELASLFKNVVKSEDEDKTYAEIKQMILDAEKKVDESV